MFPSELLLRFLDDEFPPSQGLQDIRPEPYLRAHTDEGEQIREGGNYLRIILVTHAEIPPTFPNTYTDDDAVIRVINVRSFLAERFDLGHALESIENRLDYAMEPTRSEFKANGDIPILPIGFTDQKRN